MINMSNRDYRVLVDTEFPLSRSANLIWLGFSEEGQLMSFDSEGIVRAFSFNSQQWTPIFDFKQKHAEIYDRIWIVGVMDAEILVIVMPKDSLAPSINQKSQIKRFAYKVPLLDQESALDSKELTRS